MRDVLFTAIFAVLLALALRSTWVGALLWTWISLMNPHRLTYGFAYGLPFALLAALATLASIMWSRGKVRLPADPLVVILVLFVLWTCVTTYYAILPTESADRLVTVVKIQLMTLVCIAAIRERKHVEMFVWVNLLSVGFYGVKGGIFALATGGSARVWGPQDSYIEDNNALGLALVMIIPLGYYLWQVTVQRYIRHLLLVVLLLCSVAVLTTQSRGAFISIIAMSLLLWTRTKRKVLGGLALGAAGVLFLTFMPQSWFDRMDTIRAYEADTSAMQRINAWETALNIANDRVTGAGFAVANREIFERYSPNPDWVFTAHSIYFQTLGEHGWLGLLLFVSMGALGFRNAARTRRAAREHPEAFWVHDLCGMIQVAMLGYGVGGSFLSLAYWDLPYNLIVMLIACKYWLIEERWRTEKVGFLGATSADAVHPTVARSAAG